MSTILFTAWGYEVSILEFIAALTSFVGVWLGTTGKRITWPWWAISSALYGVFFYQVDLFASAVLQIVFIVAAVYGWKDWAPTGAVPGNMSNRNRRYVAIGTIVSVAILTPVLSNIGAAATWSDAFLLIGSLVALLDVGIAVLAGLLILPAMYVALASGVEIFDAQGGLIAGPGLIISVLPALFDNMGAIGGFVAFAFFALMTIASLTSSISMLEVPVSFVVESQGVRRPAAAMLLGSIIAVISLVIVFNFDLLFEWVVTVTTEMSQPLLGLFFCLFTGWIWNRSAILEEIKQGSPQAASGFFWRVWPFYIRFICPAAIIIVYLQ